jgi:hypothetical protein
MSKRPTKVPLWGYNATAGQLVEPPTGLAKQGWSAEQRPAAPYMNALLNQTGAWINFLRGPQLGNWTRRTWSSSPTTFDIGEGHVDVEEGLVCVGLLDGCEVGSVQVLAEHGLELPGRGVEVGAADLVVLDGVLGGVDGGLQPRDDRAVCRGAIVPLPPGGLRLRGFVAGAPVEVERNAAKPSHVVRERCLERIAPHVELLGQRVTERRVPEIKALFARVAPKVPCDARQQGLGLAVRLLESRVLRLQRQHAVAHALGLVLRLGIGGLRHLAEAGRRASPHSKRASHSTASRATATTFESRALACGRPRAW